MTIRVLVADDHAAVRAGLVLILDGAPDIEIVGEATDGEQAVAMARELEPDVVVMDVRMPRLDGIGATEALRGHTDVLILTTFDIDEYVFGALQAGAAGFLLKNTDADALIDAVRVVARGDGLISPAVTRRLIARFAKAVPVATAPLDLTQLTPREREVFAALGKGAANAEIAAELGMAEATVKTHVSRVLAKLGLRSRVHAAIRAREAGLA